MRRFGNEYDGYDGGILKHKLGVLFLLPLMLFAWAGGLHAQAPGFGKLKLKVKPTRAGVFVDGKYVGPAANFGRSRSYSVAPGPHEVRLSEPRYQDLVKTITIVPGQTFVMKEKLIAVPLERPPFGVLRIEHPDKFAAVYIN